MAKVYKFETGGIYRLVSKATGKVYIGSTSHFVRRKDEHMSLLRNRNHYNYRLMDLVREHGLDDLVFEEVEIYEGSDRMALYEIEQTYLDNLKPELNIADCTFVDGIFSPTPVLQYDVNGNFMLEYSSSKEAGYAMEVGHLTINTSISRGYLTGGFMWRWKTSEVPEAKITPFDFKLAEGGSGNLRRYYAHANMPIYQWDLEGNLLKEWACKEDIVKEINCYFRSLDDHLNGQRGSLMGYVFTNTKVFPGYVNKKGEYNSSRIRLTPTGNLITTGILEFPSLSAAGRYFGAKGDSFSYPSSVGKQWRGYSIRIYDEVGRDKKVVFTPVTGEVLEFSSITETGKHFGVSDSGISRSINNESMIWKDYTIRVLGVGVDPKSE